LLQFYVVFLFHLVLLSARLERGQCSHPSGRPLVGAGVCEDERNQEDAKVGVLVFEDLILREMGFCEWWWKVWSCGVNLFSVEREGARARTQSAAQGASTTMQG
jgi:hypothetical protein